MRSSPSCPEKFIENLESLMEIAAGFGMRAKLKESTGTLSFLILTPP